MANTDIYDSDLEDGNASAYNAGDESDDESLIGVDSPTDGYFERRALPRETFAANPNVVRSAEQEEDKAGEAAGERQRARSRSVERAAGSRAHARIAVGNEEPTPILDAGPAPPDYAAATAHRREETVRYGTLASSPEFQSDHPLVRNGLFGEQGVLGNGGQEPQSMRDPPVQHSSQQSASGPRGGGEISSGVEDLADEETGLLIRRQTTPAKRKWRRRRWRLCCGRPMTCLNISLIIAVILLIVLVSRTTFQDPNHNDQPSPGNGSGNGGGGKEKQPVDDDPDDHPGNKHPKVPIPDHPHSKECPFTHHSEYKTFDFYDLDNFSFLELIDASEYPHALPSGASISGTLQVSPAEDQEADIRVLVRVATTDPWSVKRLRYVKDYDGLELEFPELEEPEDDDGGSFESRACLDMAVLVQVRQGLSVQNWDISTANMDVVIDSRLFSPDEELDPKPLPSHSPKRDWDEGEGLTVLNMTVIEAMTGDVNVDYWQSNDTLVSALTGDISGLYALQDSLTLETVSGKIDISVDPKKAAQGPAYFTATSNSGDIEVGFPLIQERTSVEDLVPERIYITRVETYSSNIRGSYVFASKATFKSFSGNLDLTVLPFSVHAPEEASHVLHTTTFSGNTSVDLLDPQYVEGKAQDWTLISTHKTTTGDLRLRYPSHWAGVIDGKSASGDFDVRGHHLRKVKDTWGLGEHVYKARSGREEGESRMEFRTLSGDVYASVAEFSHEGS